VPLRLGRHTFADDRTLVMAIVNRTPDSFFDQGATFSDDAALAAVDLAVAEGADIIDIGGVKAGPGQEVPLAEEVRRVVPFVAAVRARASEVVISVDTYRHEVARAVVGEGADLLNDAWGGTDPLLAEVAAEHGVGLVCTHAGGQQPRTRPHRKEYADVMADVVARTVGEAERAAALGVDRDRILVDPGHDFVKSTRHSLEVTRRLDELVATGWPVLVALSRKFFIGETLERPDPNDRLLGTLATTSVAAWLGARVFRVHDVARTREVLDMVASIQGVRPPAVARRGLA
jgi:dihydropteroate synthase